MLRNYIKIAIRNLRKNKTFSFLNILGLSVSLAVCLLIIMIVSDQYGFDTYHTNKDRIYRVHTTRYEQTGMETASSALPLAQKIKSDYPIVEHAVALNKQIGGDLIYKESYASGGGYFTESDIFDILDFTFLEGDSNTALDQPYSLVISTEIKELLFPNESALGKVVQFHDKGVLAMGVEEGNFENEFGAFTITGVLEPNPGKTHLPFKFLASQKTMHSLRANELFFFDDDDWTNVWTNYTYVLLKQGHGKEDLQIVLDEISKEKYENRKTTDKFSFKAVPLDNLSPGGMVGNATHISMPKMVLYILTILCLVVMLSACLNYTNMSVAQTLRRFKEVGVRKVAGASRAQVFTQFITEAVVISLLSLVFAYSLLILLQNVFQGLWLNSFLNISFEQNLSLILIFIGFSILVGFIAGMLPAIYISAIRPVNLFEKFQGIKFFRGIGLHKALMVVQFVVSLVFMISVLLLNSQAKHLLNFEYGFETENIGTVKLYNPENYDRFAQSISVIPTVTEVGATSILPAGGVNMGAMAFAEENLNDTIQVNYMDFNAAATDVFDLELLAGSNLPDSNNENYILLNEVAVKDFQFISNEDAIGKKIVIEGENLEVFGVVRNFNFLTPDRPIESLLIRGRENQIGYAIIKIAVQDQAKTLTELEKTWKQVNPDTKFVFKFLDDELLFIHTLLTDVLYVIGLLSFLAILVACLGLLGMAAYNAETRFKEIGIRKVLGSETYQIILQLSKGFLILLAIATLVSIPIAYSINSMWLEFFAYHIEIGFHHIFIGVGMVLALSLSMIFAQSYRAASANPIKSLRTE